MFVVALDQDNLNGPQQKCLHYFSEGRLYVTYLFTRLVEARLVQLALFHSGKMRNVTSWENYEKSTWFSFQLHCPSMLAVKAKIYGVLYKQSSSIDIDETSSYWSALESF